MGPCHGYTRGLGPGNTPPYTHPLYPGYTPCIRTRTCLYPHCACRTLLNAIGILSKLLLVDHRFTVNADIDLMHADIYLTD